ncbi:MAG: hypothetical protein Q8P39_00715 [Candidatus Yanofskybacteria bacterium]|nr:hypothetical protein [Candidatus Yanofskybacteria bacterium]
MDILGECPPFMPTFQEVAMARQWAIAMQVLMPLHKRACELRCVVPSSARLSREFVLPRIEAGQNSDEIVEAWKEKFGEACIAKKVVRLYPARTHL